MNKGQLIATVAKKAKLSKAMVNNLTDHLLTTIRASLSKGVSVQIVGFGTWRRRKRSARMGRNPQTGKAIKIPARNVPVFKAGEKLKSAVH